MDVEPRPWSRRPAAVHVRIAIVTAVGTTAATALLVAWLASRDASRALLFSGSATFMALLALGLALRGSRGTFWERRHGSLAILWQILAGYGIVMAVLLASMGGVIAAGDAVDAGRTVVLDYRATLGPADDETPYVVRIPAATHIDDWTVTPSDTAWRLETTEHGRAIEVEAVGNVTLTASAVYLLTARGLDAYRLTLGDPDDENAYDGRTHHAYRDAVAEVQVDVAFDVDYGQGTYEHRLGAALDPGWGEYQSFRSHPHGDGDFTRILLPVMPFAGILLALHPVFLGAVLVLGVHAGVARMRLRRTHDG